MNKKSRTKVIKKFMNIGKLLLIIAAVAMTGILSAMDSKPLKHADIIDIMLRNGAFSSAAPAVELINGKIYTFKSIGGGWAGWQRKFIYIAERQISFLKILDYKTEVALFVGCANTSSDSEIEKLKKRNSEKDLYISYETNYSNIAKTGILLAAGVALVRFAWMYAVPAAAKA
jgi:hypothetical protein